MSQAANRKPPYDQMKIRLYHADEQWHAVLSGWHVAASTPAAAYEKLIDYMHYFP